jgi:hypothetical protein
MVPRGTPRRNACAASSSSRAGAKRRDPRSGSSAWLARIRRGSAGMMLSMSEVVGRSARDLERAAPWAHSVRTSSNSPSISEKNASTTR